MSGLIFVGYLKIGNNDNLEDLVIFDGWKAHKLHRESFWITSRFPFQMEIADYILNDDFYDFIPFDSSFVSLNVTAG